MENEGYSSYEEAVEYLKGVNIVAPVFYICVGESGDQGIVIARDRKAIYRVKALSGGDYYIAQDNSDWGGRRVHSRASLAAKQMQEIKNGEEGHGNGNPDIRNLLRTKVLLKEPNLNAHTIASSITDVQRGEMDIY